MPGENLEAVFTPVIRWVLYAIAAAALVGLFACLAWG